jgi:hypothetical protein
MVGSSKQKEKKHTGRYDRVNVTEPPNPVNESYSPGMRGAVGPFPIGKRKERKKTETFRRSE